MKRFRDWSIAQRINSVVLLVIMLMSGLSYIQYHYYQKATTAVNNLYTDSFASVRHLDEAVANIKSEQALVAELMAAGISPEKVQQISTQVKIFQGFTDTSLSDYAQLAQEQFKIAKLAQVRQTLNSFNQNTDQFVQLILSEDPTAHDYYTSNVAVYSDQVNSLLSELADYNAQEAKSSMARNNLDFTKAKQLQFFLPLLAALLALAFGALIARSLTLPLKAMLGSVKEVAQGNLLVKDIEAKTQNELGQLTRAFNQMTANLRNIVVEMNQTAVVLNGSAEEFKSINETNNQASQQIASSINRVAVDASKQAEVVEIIRQASGELSGHIQEIDQNGDQMTEMTEKTLEAAKNGKQAIQTAMGQMDKIGERTQAVEHAFNDLALSSREIAKVVNVISNITQQTNLLSLNASIEAARAGEFGNSFKVVANEVRKLSEQSQQAAKQIAAMVAVNQENINKALQVISEEVNDVKLGIEDVRHAGSAFEEIADSIDSVTVGNNSIAVSVKETLRKNEVVVDAIKEITDISQNTASESQNVSAVVEEQTAVWQQINGYGSQLAGIAQTMKGKMNAFQVAVLENDGSENSVEAKRPQSNEHQQDEAVSKNISETLKPGALNLVIRQKTVVAVTRIKSKMSILLRKVKKAWRTRAIVKRIANIRIGRVKKLS